MVPSGWVYGEMGPRLCGVSAGESHPQVWYGMVCGHPSEEAT